MSMLERFRAPKNLELRDKDAGATPLRDDKKGKLKNGELKERERALTAELTAEVAKLQEKLYAARDRKLLLILQGISEVIKSFLVILKNDDASKHAPRPT